jgi:type VI secretion system secreted protein Hcp
MPLFDAFLKIEGIEGDSLDKSHPGEIELISYSFGLTQTGSPVGGGGGEGKAVFQDFHFSSHVSKASPNLMLACATGRHFTRATLTCRKAGGGGGFEFVKIRLDDCLVSGYQLGGEGSEELPTDSFSLSFVKIDFLYTVERTGETVETVFDQRHNT